MVGIVKTIFYIFIFFVVLILITLVVFLILKEQILHIHDMTSQNHSLF